MKKLLDLIGSPFVYRSPTNKVEAWRRNAMYMTCKQLRQLTGIRAHYAKAIYISRYINENMSHLK